MKTQFLFESETANHFFISNLIDMIYFNDTISMILNEPNDNIAHPCLQILD